MAVQGFGNSTCGIWAAEFELHVKQALLPAGPCPRLCQLSKCLPAAVPSPCCQAGACVEGAWETEFGVESEHLVQSFISAQFLCPKSWQANIFSRGAWLFPCSARTFACCSCLTRGSDKTRWQSCCSPQQQCSLHGTHTVCSWQVKGCSCWRTPSPNSAAGEVSPIQGPANQADSTAMSMENVSTPLSRCSAIREDPVEMGVKPCSKQPSASK